MEIQQIDGLEEAEDLTSEWSRLWERCPSGTPFHAPEWLLCWWRDFGFGQLFLLALRENGQLVGLAPLFIHRKAQEPQHAPNMARQVSPIGVGITDYTDFLIEPWAARFGTALILKHLEKRQDLWDECDLQGIRSDNPLPKLPTPDGLHSHVLSGEPCPVLALPDTAEATLSMLPTIQQRNFRRAWQKLGRSGDVTVVQATKNNAQDLLTALFRLHEARWRDRNLQGALGDLRIQQFHREVASAFLKRGWLRLKAIVCGGSIAAVLYGFVARGTAYNYQSGFDPKFKRLSPGTLIIGHALLDAIREHSREFDFLRGGEAYKYSWGARDRDMYRVLLRPCRAPVSAPSVHTLQA